MLAIDISLGNINWASSNPSSSPVNHAHAPLNSAELAKLRKPSSQSSSLELSFKQSTTEQAAADQSMVFQRAHPGPFKPRGMHVEEIQNQPTMMHVVAGRRPHPRNEDLAIVTISPLPGNALHFPIVEEVVRKLLEEHMRIQVKRSSALSPRSGFC